MGTIPTFYLSQKTKKQVHIYTQIQRKTTYNHRHLTPACLKIHWHRELKSIEQQCLNVIEHLLKHLDLFPLSEHPTCLGP